MTFLELSRAGCIKITSPITDITYGILLDYEATLYRVLSVLRFGIGLNYSQFNFLWITNNDGQRDALITKECTKMTLHWQMTKVVNHYKWSLVQMMSLSCQSCNDYATASHCSRLSRDLRLLTIQIHVHHVYSQCKSQQLYLFPELQRDMTDAAFTGLIIMLIIGSC